MENTMIAKVNGKSIPVKELDLELNKIMASYQNSVPKDQLPLLRSKLRDQAVENLINRELLYQEACRQDIQPSPAEIKAELDKIISRFPSPEDFEKQVSKLGLSRDAILEDIERQLKLHMVMKNAVSEKDVSVTEQEIETYYKENQKSFHVQEHIKASHILFKFDSQDSEETKNQKRLELAGLQGKIQQGEDFASLAEKHSDCPSSKQGGDLGYFDRGKMAKPFEDAAFSLGKNEVSEIVETKFGYHLIKKLDQIDARTVPLKEIKDKLSTHLKNQKENQALDSYLEKLRKGATIEYAAATK
jgi:peptidyl-prolyl cis-trans isomerase C